MPAISSILAGAAIAGSVGSAVIGGNAQKDAAKAAAQTAAENNRLQQYMFDKTSEMYKPYVEGGVKPFDLYNKSIGAQGQEGVDSALSTFYNVSPDYKEALKVGTANVEQSAASQGNFLSGTRLRNVMDYGGSTFNKYLSDWRNSLLQSANIGIGATGNVASALGNMTTGMTANNNMASGARQSAYINTANQWGNALQNIGNVGGNWAGQRFPAGGGGADYSNNPYVNPF